jgi:hypothetical protein
MFSLFGEKLNNAYPSNREIVPESSFGYHSNNQYDNFPPLMSDGRALVASWQPEAVANKQLINENGITSNWQYRRYLTHNANSIMKTNFRESANDVGYIKLDDKPESSTGGPFSFKSFLDDSKPLGYKTSDLKNLYLSREQLNARKVSPAITQEQLLASASQKK